MSSEGGYREYGLVVGPTFETTELMESVSTRKQRIALAAKKYRHEPLTALNHHLDLNWLAEAYSSLRKNAAVGVDGQSVVEYGENLTENLRDLQTRAKSGSYKAPPVKRVYIPKNENEDRAIGIPTVEDKVLQRSVAMILEAVYEQEFLPFSFGFRPGRNQHQALEYLRKQCYQQKVKWILEVDLRQFFDRVDHRKMRELLSCRVQDGVINRLIAKWLKAGVWEAGQLSYPEQGTPQGGVISPLLSNIYLHEVLDKWFVESVQPACSGRTFMVRFADDFIMGFESLDDVEKLQRVIGKRFAKYGLEINVKKTRLINFAEPPKGGNRDGKKPETFDFLGFTHYWGKSRKGNYAVKKKTAGSRFRRTLKSIKDWGWRNRHLPLKKQQEKLNQKLRGHDAYYGVTGNWRMLSRLRYEVAKLWRQWLGRRNRGGRKPNWEKFQAILKTFPLAPVRVVHSTYAAKP